MKGNNYEHDNSCQLIEFNQHIMTFIRLLLQRCQTRDKDGKLQTTTDKLNHYILTKRKKEILHTVFYRELA